MINKEQDDTWKRAFGHMSMKGETERKIHKRLASYLKNAYPNVRFVSTLDGERFSMPQAEAVRALMWGRGVPDMLIFRHNGPYVGLAIEIKLNSVYKQDGRLRKGQHLSEQADWLDYLEKEGWRAVFGCGYEQCVDIVDEYLKYIIR